MAFGSLKGTLSLTGTDVGTTNALAGSVSVAVGDLVFAVFGEVTSLTASGASDNLGNTYAAQNAGTDSGGTSGRAFWSRVTVAGTLTTVTIAATSSSHNFSGFAGVIEGPFASSPLDANPANGTSDIVSPYTCPATGTLAQADEAVIAWGVAALGATVSATSPNLLGGQQNDAGNSVRAVLGYQAVSATTSVAPEFTKAGGNPTDAVWGTASFKKAAVSSAKRFYSYIIG